MSSDEDIPENNGALLNITQIIKAVLLSAVEAELGESFSRAKLAVPVQTTLVELGHPQPRAQL